MANIDLPGFIMTVVTTSALVFCFRYLIPRIVMPWVEAALNDATALLDRGQPLPNEDQLRTSRAILNNRFIRLRTASHRAPEFLPQLGLILSGVTYRLYNVWWDIIAFKREVELAIDEQQLMIDEQQQATDRVQLATLAAAQNIPPTVLPVSTINTAAPANDVAEPTLLPPAAAP